MISVLLAAFAPLIGLIVAIILDRERRKKTEKPPKSEKLLRRAGYLTKRAGEQVEIFPVVVIPGWFVRISERGNFLVWVMNSTRLPNYLSAQSERIDPAQVRRIYSALDDK